METDADGRPVSLIGVAMDITERKQAEERLRESEERYRTLVETTFDWVWEVDDEGRYTTVSPKIRELLGYAPEEVLGRTPFDLMPEAEARRVGAIFREIASRREPFSALENVNRHKDGRLVTLETSGVPTVDAGGRFKGYRGMDRDITARKNAEAALRRSEAHLRTLVNTLPDLVWLKDPQGVYLACNARFEMLFAAAAADIVGKTDDDFGARPVADVFRANDAAAVAAGGQRMNEEEVTFASDGHKELLETIKTPMFDAEGNLVGVLGISRDITARKKAELALEAEASRMAALLDAQREIASADLEYAGLIQLILARMSRLSGAEGASLEVAEGEEMVYEAATGMAARFTGLRLKIAGSLSGRCMTSGELMRSDDVESDARVDRETCQKIGLRSMILVPLRYDEHAFGVLKLMSPRAAAFSAAAEQSLRLMGEFLGATVSRKRTEMLLREREERLQTLGDNIPSGSIYQLHSPREGRNYYTYVSAGIERIFGMPAASVLADPAPFWKLIAEEDRAAINEAQARSLRELTLFDCEFRQRTVSGEVKWLHAIARPRRLADGSTTWDGVLMDITERKRAEAERANLEAQLQQAQKLESVGRLAGGVAHDFNNLLMSIMGHAELCREGLGKGHPLCSDLNEIMDAAQRSAGITRQLLAFARQQTVAPVVLNVNDHVANTLKLLQRLIGENVELTWRPRAQQALVKMDPSQLDQILANLAVNARDAIDGVGKITVETKEVVFDAQTCPKQEEADPGTYVMLTFSDTGCGMDRQTLEHIFEPFFTTKPVGQGTGLGLATVYGIVKQNKGMIDVQSEPGKGASFRIYLRRHEVPAEAGEARSAAPEEPGGSETLLLVEDEEGVRSVTARFLRRLGYTVLSAGSPAAATSLIAEHAGRVHLLITDVVMPGMSGKDLAAKLSEAYPGIKCLLMSGYPDGNVAHQGTLEEGMHFLAKPFSIDALARKVREVLESR
jgi:PAS domain S-box-containing protein